MPDRVSPIAALLQNHMESLIDQWTAEQLRGKSAKISRDELQQQCREFLVAVTEAAGEADIDELSQFAWQNVKRLLGEISRSRTIQGFTPSETATFVFSLKKPLFELLRKELATDSDKFASQIWKTTQFLDHLGLYSADVYLKTKEEVIARQQEDMLELSTPVVKLWDGILALPMIGTLDSSRTQVVMETLLQKIVDTGSEVAIIDITGVPTVDTLVAQHLIKTVTAARLMGADCFISGIRPQIAATIVHLGIDLTGVTTKATLADAFQLALHISGKTVEKLKDGPASRNSRT